MTGTPAELDWPEQQQFMDEFNKELARGSDRALALVSGAMIDELMRRLLISALPHSSGLLFEGANAPFGSWSSRANVIRALGLVSADDHRRLNLMRKMRNEMAHQLSLKLSDPAFVSRVKELMKGIGGNTGNLDDRANFGVASLYLIGLLSVRIAEVKRHSPVRVLFD